MAVLVDTTMEIHAPALKVWGVLTERQFTDQWSPGFSDGGHGGPRLFLESDWDQGSPMRWKDEKGNVVAEGIVSIGEPVKRLRYCVFAVKKSCSLPLHPDDSVTYEIAEMGEMTMLHLLMENYSTTDNGYARPATGRAWGRTLQKIKKIAERDDGEPIIPSVF